MGTKENVLDLVQQAYQEELAFISKLTGEERSAQGTPEKWAAKDVIIHIVVWQGRMVDNFHAVARGEALPTYDDIDRENARIFEAHHPKPWEDVRQMTDDAYTRMADYVRAASEEDLVDPARSALKGTRPLWQNIIGNYVQHPLLHLGQFYAARGDREYANQLLEKMTRQMGVFDDSPTWRANSIYNLACHYATTGQKNQAITLLKEALALNPALTEWSTRDPDFASIREDAEYKAVYA